MNDRQLISDDFWTLLDAACADELSLDQWAELQAHLERNPAARQAYIEHIRLRTNIRQWWKGERAREAGLERIKAEGVVDKREEGDLGISGFGDVGFENLEIWRFGDLQHGGDSLHPSYPSYPSHPSHPSLSPLPSPLSVGGPVFSYIAATVILGVMLLSAWAYKITHDYGPSLASNSRRSTTSGSTTPQRPALVFVGRVTGLKDCRWSDPQTEAYAGAAVPLGRKYALSSGLMEITYLSGAKVILEGPCSYEVESAAGGFLALGKLTARIGERGEGRGKRGKNGRMKADSLATSHSPLATNHSPPSPLHSPLFTVRTPTAVVTDLGTEFGVEVSENGDTASHVFSGSVKVEVVGGDARRIVVLRENESARVRKAENGKPSLASRESAFDSARFVRRIPTRAIAFGGSYNGSFNPYYDAPPAGQSAWSRGSAALTPVPNDDNGVVSPGVANFNDLSGKERMSVHRPMGPGAFRDNQADDEYVFSARLKLHGDGVPAVPSLALLCLGFRDEWNGGDFGKTVMLGWFVNNPDDGNNPGLWLVESRTKGAARAGAVKINNVNYFNDAWHEYRVEKALERGVAKIMVYVDSALKLKVNYADLPEADGGENGFGYFSSTPGTARVAVDYFEYRVYADRATTFDCGRTPSGNVGRPQPDNKSHEKLGKEVANLIEQMRRSP